MRDSVEKERDKLLDKICALEDAGKTVNARLLMRANVKEMEARCCSLICMYSARVLFDARDDTSGSTAGLSAIDSLICWYKESDSVKLQLWDSLVAKPLDALLSKGKQAANALSQEEVRRLGKAKVDRAEAKAAEAKAKADEARARADREAKEKKWCLML